MKPNFTGFATKAGLECSDGRVILPDAFKHQDKTRVPLIWRHQQDNLDAVLGHVILEAKDGDVLAHAYFNDSDSGKKAKRLVEHGDVASLSIWANGLVEKGKQVLRGNIKEVSLVLAGANPGATISNVNIVHEDGFRDYLEEEAIITTGLPLIHADEDPNKETSNEDTEDGDEETLDLQAIYETLNEEQKEAFDFAVGVALETDPKDLEKEDETANTEDEDQPADDKKDEEEDDKKSPPKIEHMVTKDGLTHQEGNAKMKTNIFENENGVRLGDGKVLSHDDLQSFKTSVFDDFRKNGSFRNAVLAHAADYGITNVEVLFPDAKTVDGKPEWITRKMEYVDVVLNGARKLPFARVKSRSADLTHEEARAKGYIKGNVKKEQFFAVAQRETTPTTVYKKQKLDRDDIIDVTEFDLVAWLWEEMRFMLREEIARAILIGDGRPTEDPANPGSLNPDKIDPTKIRPIATDDDFYTHKVYVPSSVSPSDLIDSVVRARKFYKGSGNPILFTTEDLIADLLLLKDKLGRRLYNTEDDLRSALRVSQIVPVEVLEGETDENGNAILGVMYNPADYSIGTDRGGEITTFDQFDIDVNQHKYLIEGRMSGALTQHKRAISIWRSSGTQATPTEPVYSTIDTTTFSLNIPSVTGVDYFIDGEATPAGEAGPFDETVIVTAQPKDGYYFEAGTVASWTFNPPSIG